MGWLDGFVAQQSAAIGFLPYAWLKVRAAAKNIVLGKRDTVEGHRVLDK